MPKWEHSSPAYCSKRRRHKKMKCSPMKLYQRVECPRRKLDKYFQKGLEEQPRYFTQKHHGYSITFIRNLFSDQRKSPKLSVNNIKLPENISSYNTGSSLDKWAKKRPRLKSGNKKGYRETLDILDENAYDISEIIEILDRTHVVDEERVCEVNSDIEELWKKSQSSEENSRNEQGDIYFERIKKKKHRSKKYIRFSLSKPASPQTQQIIRVEISSTISLSDFNQLQQNENPSTNDQNYKEDNIKTNEDDEEQNFVLRCRQLDHR